MKTRRTVNALRWSPERVTYPSEGRRPSLTDPCGTITQHYQYTPFGELFVHQNTQQYHNPYDFSARERDIETGFQYFGARHYHSEWGIWLSVDPLADLAPHLTPYRYAFNNPIRYHDPSGLIEVAIDGGGEPDPNPEVIIYSTKSVFSIEVDRIRTPFANATSYNPWDNFKSQLTGMYAQSELMKQNTTSTSSTQSAKTNSEKVAALAGGKQYMASAIVLSALLLADDATIVGVADDIFIPFILGGAYMLDNDLGKNAGSFAIGAILAVTGDQYLLYAKGKERNWPDQFGPKPRAEDVDWSKSNDKLAEELANAVNDARRGPGSPHGIATKVFRELRPGGSGKKFKK